MKLRLLILFLIVTAGAQAQIHQRIHQKDRTIIGIPIADIDSVTNIAGTKTIRYKDATSESFQINTIDSITHAVPVTNNLYTFISGVDSISQFKAGIDRGILNPFPYALSGNYTALIPENSILNAYGVNPSNLTEGANNYIFSYHTIVGKFNTADFPSGENVKYYTANFPADSVFVTKTSNNIYVNGCRINPNSNQINIQASNGVAHLVEDFLFPPGLDIYSEIQRTGRNYDSLKLLVDRAAIADPKIVDTLKSTVLTLLAPRNSAFATFLTSSGIGSIKNITPTGALSILRDHMLIGRKFLINIVLATNPPGTGSKSYGGGNLLFSNIGGNFGSIYYKANAAVPLANFDLMHENGVIQPISGILTK
jgi:uncharacterized surface protein with fasciclin (FAS1) repeats